MAKPLMVMYSVEEDTPDEEFVDDAEYPNAFM